MSAPARATALVATAALALASCATLTQQFEENPKAVLGAVGGAALGAGIAALAGGNAGVVVGSAVAGGLVGGIGGHYLDNRDKELAAQAAQRAFESGRTGQATVWNNPDNGHSGSITPVKTYQLASGEYCREYKQTIQVGGEPQQAYGTACRQPDGSWQIQS